MVQLLETWSDTEGCNLQSEPVLAVMMHQVFGKKNGVEKRRTAGYKSLSMWGGGGGGGDMIPPKPGEPLPGCEASKNFEKGLCCP
jgi:hypothetical protein